MQGGGMDLSSVGEMILSSVRSARSLGLLQSTSDRPEVPDRAAAAAAVAHVLVGLPPHHRHNLTSTNNESSSIYRGKLEDKVVEVLEDGFYEQEFDPMRYVLMLMPEDESELSYFEQQASLRLAQLDGIAEQLSHHVMEHHEEMVKGMNLVREMEKDLKIANVICMNGRRYLASSMNEVSRELIVSSISKKKQALLDLLRILHELYHALEMRASLEIHTQEGNYYKAFQILPEYLQILDGLSNLSVVQEMSIGIEVWLGRTLEKLDAVLLEVCQEFNKNKYNTVIEAYSLMGDVSGLSEKIQSYFMQEVISETHSVLKNFTQEQGENQSLQDRFTYSDLCLRIPDLKFRQCLLKTLAVLFRLITSYYSIMDFQTFNKMANSPRSEEESMSTLSLEATGCTKSSELGFPEPLVRDSGMEDSTISHSPWYQLRKEATSYVSQSLHSGRNNLWQLMTTRVSVLLSSASVYSLSVHQFLRNYEDLNTFILAGEAFCGAEAFEFRRKLKGACENYFGSSHRQNIHALQLVLEKESWVKMGPSTTEVISFAGLLGDGAPLIVSYDSRSPSTVRCNTSTDPVQNGVKLSGFSRWIGCPNPFQTRLTNVTKECSNGSLLNGMSITGETVGFFQRNNDSYYMNGSGYLVSEDESEDLLADFIDEDSQLPSRISKTGVSKKQLSRLKDCETPSQTGSSLYLLRLMDKYARLMQRLEIINLEFFKGICQLFEIFFHFVYETFGQHETYPGGKSIDESLNHRLKMALSRISQDCSQWIRPKLQSVDKTQTSNSASPRMDVTPSSPCHITQFPFASFTLKERCAGAETLSLTAHILNRSKSHLQSMLFQNNVTVVEDFYTHLVDVVPDLVAHIHKTSAVLILHIHGYVERISNTRWELKELGLEHNGYVDLLLGEFKHYKTRLVHGGIQEEVQGALVEYGMEIVGEIIVEGLSRVKRCNDEGRALMSLDLQVLINGLQHFTPDKVRPKLQPVDTFIKAYYLPETEFVHWARTHPEYSRSQVNGLINLVAVMKGWKRKTRLEVIEKISTI